MTIATDPRAPAAARRGLPGGFGRRGSTGVAAKPSGRLGTGTGPAQTWVARVRFRVALADAIAIYLALFVAHRLRFGIGEHGWFGDLDALLDPAAYSTRHAFAVLGLFVAWLAALALANAWDTRIMGAGSVEYSRIVNATLAFFGALAVFAYLVQWQLARGVVAIALPLGVALLCAGRRLLRSVLAAERRAGLNVRRTLLVGSSDGVAHVADELRRVPEAGYQVIGVCVDRSLLDGAAPGPEYATFETDAPVTGRIAVQLPILGATCDAVAYAAAHPVDAVIVASGAATPASVTRLAWDLEPYVTEVMLAPGLADVASPRLSTRPVAGLPLMHLEPPGHTRPDLRVKRVLDVLTAAALLVLLSPLLVVVALAIKLTSPGPVFFTQTRVGEGGRLFQMIKFRSMVPNAEARWREVMGDSVGFVNKVKDDPRITPIGKFIRRFSIDELPQLLNVLLGSMSLVGPRPPLIPEAELYDAAVRRRLFVKPGMTGLWQVSGRANVSPEYAMRLDLYYAANWSLGADVMILFRTARAVFGRDGAY